MTRIVAGLVIKEKMMKIIVYFEIGRASHIVAQFFDEELYMACLPALEKEATKGGYMVTESCREDGDDDFDIDGRC